MLFDPFVTFNPLFQPVAARAGFWPHADVTVGDNDMVLTMDLPGLTADDLDLEVLEGQLIIRGERRRPELAEGTQWALTERSFGRFERRIGLPKGVDADAITASFDNGVLSLIVPKPEALKPRTIQIGTGTEQRRLETANA
jgi:HSP20 family protein